MEDNTEMGFREICCEDVGWNHLAMDNVQQVALVNMAMNIRVSQKASNVVITTATKNF
jgi:hypothetical protein